MVARKPLTAKEARKALSVAHRNQPELKNVYCPTKIAKAINMVLCHQDDCDGEGEDESFDAYMWGGMVQALQNWYARQTFNGRSIDHLSEDEALGVLYRLYKVEEMPLLQGKEKLVALNAKQWKAHLKKVA